MASIIEVKLLLAAHAALYAQMSVVCMYVCVYVVAYP